MLPRSLILLSLLCLPVAACAGPAAPSGGGWTKAGASAQSFTADHFACRAEAKNTGVRPSTFGAMTPTDPLESDRVYATCMTTRGYRPDPRGFTPPEQSGIVTR